MRRDVALHNGAKASMFSRTFAEVAELVDAHDSGLCTREGVEVRGLHYVSVKNKDLGIFHLSYDHPLNVCKAIS